MTRCVLRWLIYPYTLFWLLYLTLRWLWGDRLGAVAFVSNWVPAALLPSFVLPIVGWRKRDRLLEVAGSILILFLATQYGARFLPKPSRQLGDNTRLTVLSHNTGQDLPGYAQRLDTIIQSGAQIVLLQEITREFIEQNQSQLSAAYPYQTIGPFQPDRDQEIGMAILSQHPILAADNFKLADDGLVFQQRAVVRLDEQDIVVYNIHTTFPWIYLRQNSTIAVLPLPDYDDEVRSAEVAHLSKMIAAEQSPVLIGGDFNMADQSDDYNVLHSSGLIDAYREAGYGFGFTWPANRTPSVEIRPAIPLVRVDYLFSTPHFEPVSAHVLTKTGSDHLPISAILSLVKPQRS